jgi:hypothetical protein
MRVAPLVWAFVLSTACLGRPVIGSQEQDVASAPDSDAELPDAEVLDAEIPHAELPTPDVASDLAPDLAPDAPPPPVCTAADNTCVDLHRARTCRPDGTAFEERPCPDIELCLDGRCVVPACTLDARRCGMDGRPERCDGRAWIPAAPCAATERCVSGACECAPRCEGRVCGDDGCGHACGTCAAWQLCDAGRCALRPTACEPGTTRPCYTGPAATMATGRCRGGTQTCGPDGAWAAACANEIVPRAEGCANGIDEDCDGAVDNGCPPSTCVLTSNLGSALGARLATGTTVGGTARATGSCGGAEAPERVFIWTAPSAGPFTFTTRGSEYDTLVYLRDGGCDGRELACNDDVINGSSISSVVTATLTQGQTIAIVVDGFGTGAGNFVVNIAAGPPERCTPGARRSCYAGPIGTEAVGRCRAATQPCHSSGVWPDACNGSILPTREVCANAIDDDCDGMVDEGCVTAPTRPIAGRVVYQHRLPNAGRTDWGALQEASAPGFAVFALRGDERVDAARTGTGVDDLGRFTLRVRDPATPDDRIVVAALMDDGRGALSLAVADPQYPAGQRPPFAGAPAAPRVWSWSWRVDQLPADGVLRIEEAAGSGAARVFDMARQSVVHGRASSGGSGLSNVVWLGFGVTWSCGACFAPVATRAFDQDFLSQVAYPGGSDAQVWSDMVVAHEFGHWSMSSFGLSPGEGGMHTINAPLAHGIAWSEGYASWFGASVRNNPLYVDKQRGNMFWFDIGARTLSRGAWLRPDASLGVLQPIAENEVSAILWAMAPAAPRDALFAALSSRRMTVGPFARGYRSTTTMANVPVLPDFLDALACGGFPAARIDAAARPQYPYNSAAPLCAPPGDVSSPVEGSWRVVRGPTTDVRGVTTITLAAVTERRGWLEAPLRVSVRLPDGGWITDGPQAWDTPSAPGRDERTLTLAFRRDARAEVSLVYDAQGVAMGVHGEVPWRADGVREATTPSPRATGPSLRVGGRSLGPSVVVR